MSDFRPEDCLACKIEGVILAHVLGQGVAHTMRTYDFAAEHERVKGTERDHDVASDNILRARAEAMDRALE